MPVHGVHNEHLLAWVVFDRPVTRYWWRAFTGRRFGHCWVMWSKFWPPDAGLMAAEWTMKLEHSPGGLYCDMVPAPPEQVLEHFLPPAADVLQLDLRVTRSRLRYFGSLNCVTAVKALLNIRAPWCHTPSQLHRRLLAMGARSLKG